jgi:hypothetical protein
MDKAAANRASAAKYYAANRETLLKQRVLRRAGAGSAPQRRSLQRHAIADEEIVAIRSEAKKASPRDSIPSPSQIEALGGKAPKLDKDGKALAKGGVLTASSAQAYARKFSQLARILEAQDDPAAWRKHAHNIERLRALYPRPNTFKGYPSVIVTIAKYFPAFGKALGEEALKAYRDAMMVGIADGEAVGRAATEDKSKTVPNIDSLRALVPAIAEHFGAGGEEHLAALLQTTVVGLRDNLGDVRIEKEGGRGEGTSPPNVYNPKTGRLLIRRFKTSPLYQPYDYILPGDVRKTIAASLETRPRDYLVTHTPHTLSLVLKRAFKAVGQPGVTVMTIRHSMESDMLRPDAGGATGAGLIERVAAQFKHSAAMATMYVRPVAVVEPVKKTVTVEPKAARKLLPGQR